MQNATMHWQKPKSMGFLLYRLHCLPITFEGFGTKSACAKKPEYTCVLVSGAIRDFSLPLINV